MELVQQVLAPVQAEVWEKTAEGEQASPHFGRAPESTLIEIEEGRVIKREKILQGSLEDGENLCEPG